MAKIKGFKNVSVSGTLGAVAGGAAGGAGIQYIPVDNKYAKIAIVAAAGAATSAFVKGPLGQGAGAGLIGVAAADLVKELMSDTPAASSGVGLLPSQMALGNTWINRRANVFSTNGSGNNAGQSNVQ